MCVCVLLLSDNQSRCVYLDFSYTSASLSMVINDISVLSHIKCLMVCGNSVISHFIMYLVTSVSVTRSKKQNVG